MDPFTAITTAVNHLRQYPSRFHFVDVYQPESLTDCGCLLGWIGYFAGFDASYAENDVGNGIVTLSAVAKWLGYQDDQFIYDHLRKQYDVNFNTFDWRSIPFDNLQQWANEYA